VYLPHVLAAEDLVVGYLPSYLVERGVGDGRGFAMIALVIPPWAATAVAVCAGLLGGFLIWRGARPEDAARTALLLMALQLLLIAPPFAWYALPLVALAVLVDAPTWLPVE